MNLLTRLRIHCNVPSFEDVFYIIIKRFRKHCIGGFVFNTNIDLCGGHLHVPAFHMEVNLH